MIRAVLFDLDDTLIDHTSAADEAVTAWAAERGLPGTPDEQRTRWTEVSSRHYARYQSRELTFAGQRRERARDFLERELSDDDADAEFAGYLVHYEARWRPFRDARPALERLVGRGHLVAVLTNGERAHQLKKISTVGLDDLGLPVFASSDYPRGKPDPAPFLGTCQALGVDPGDTLMVGNSLRQDVGGAVGAGLQAVLLDRYDEHPDHAGRRIHSLDEL